jgi:hypothetical protein
MSKKKNNNVSNDLPVCLPIDLVYTQFQELLTKETTKQYGKLNKTAKRTINAKIKKYNQSGNFKTEVIQLLSHHNKEFFNNEENTPITQTINVLNTQVKSLVITEPKEIIIKSNDSPVTLTPFDEAIQTIPNRFELDISPEYYAWIESIGVQLRNNKIQNFIIEGLNESKEELKPSVKQQKTKISALFVKNYAVTNTQLTLNADELPQLLTHEVKLQNRLGGNIKLTPYQTDLIFGLIELNKEKSQITNSNQANYYLGNYEEPSQKQEKIKNAHFFTTFNEIATKINGGTKPSSEDKRKVTEELYNLWENAKLHPKIIYKTSRQTITINEPILQIGEAEDTATGVKQIIIKLNPAFTQDIAKQWLELPGDLFVLVKRITKDLGLTKKPGLLLPFLMNIINARNINRNGNTYETGLLENRNGEPGLWGYLGYDNYKKNGNGKRFEAEYYKAIEYLKNPQLNVITDYYERQNEWGNKIGVFILNKKEKKAVG